jgi:hypothetical protein
MALQPFVGPWPLFSFLILYTVGRTPWMGDQTVERPLPIYRTSQTHNKWDKHPYLEWNSNPRSQYSTERTHFMPQTATPLWSACGAIGGMKICRGNPKYSGATTSTTNSVWPYLGSNPGRRGGNPATNRLSYVMAPTAVRICGNKERNRKAETSSPPMTAYKNQSISVYIMASSWSCLPRYFLLICRYFSYSSVGLIVSSVHTV